MSGALDATSFWEHFEPAWSRSAGRIDELPRPQGVDVHREYGGFCFQGLRHSFCHGWAAGPSAFLISHVLGLSILSPSVARVAVRPNLGSLDWAEGTLPTPRGPVHVRHEKAALGAYAARSSRRPMSKSSVAGRVRGANSRCKYL